MGNLGLGRPRPIFVLAPFELKYLQTATEIIDSRRLKSFAIGWMNLVNDKIIFIVISKCRIVIPQIRPAIAHFIANGTARPRGNAVSKPPPSGSISWPYIQYCLHHLLHRFETLTLYSLSQRFRCLVPHLNLIVFSLAANASTVAFHEQFVNGTAYHQQYLLQFLGAVSPGGGNRSLLVVFLCNLVSVHLKTYEPSYFASADGSFRFSFAQNMHLLSFSAFIDRSNCR